MGNPPQAAALRAMRRLCPASLVRRSERLSAVWAVNWGILLALLVSPTGLAEDPRGDVYPKVEAVGDAFRLTYLANDAWYGGDPLGGSSGFAQQELSIAWVKTLTRDGTLMAGPVRGPELVTVDDTDRLCGRPIVLWGFGNGLLRSDGSDWFCVQTHRVERTWQVSLTQVGWLHLDPIELPWGKTSFRRVEPDDGKTVSLGIMAGGEKDIAPVQLFVDRQHVLIVLSPAFGRSGKEDVRNWPQGSTLYAFRRRSRGRLTDDGLKQVLKQPLPSPIHLGMVGVPCIQRAANGRYYVAYLAPTSLPHAADEFAPYPADIMLLEWVPETGQTRTARLAAKIDGYTHLSFALIGERGLLAYHQDNPLGYVQLRSRIVTQTFDIGQLDWRETGRD